MPKSTATVTGNPYGKCITCDKLGVTCIGPPLTTMEIHEQSEWCRLRKDSLHTQDRKWTNSYVAEKAEVSLTSVNRFLSGNVEDAKASTVARIERVLVGGPLGQYSCDAHSAELLERASKAESECTQLNAAHEEDRKKIEYLLKQLEDQKERIKAQDQIIADRKDFLTRKDRVIRILSTLLALCLFLIILALVVDKFNSDIGFFWVDRVNAILHGEATPTSHGLLL